MKKMLLALSLFGGIACNSNAAEYVIDTKGAHASVNLKINHLGYSWITAKFTDFSGKFSYEKDQFDDASVVVTIHTASFDSNHAERNKHVKSSDFLDAEKYPEATFTSTKVENVDASNFRIMGNLNLHGITKLIVIDAQKVGEGKDPWGGYRAGFEGKTTIALADFGITNNLGPASAYVELTLQVEGIKQ
jgi:polyisoprenoid-binding protein YceI